MKYTTTQIKEYHDAIADLFAYLDSFPKKEFMKDTSECEVYLKRTQWFLDLIGNPEKQIPHLVHITGTSGKGSATQMVHEILLASGKNVGSTYSPHPTTYIERIRVGEKFISIAEFAKGIARLKSVLEKHESDMPYGMISFFEFMFALSVDHFVRNGVTHAVLEVGLGGRFSASNTIPTPDVTIITNVGLDHTELLGDTKEKIAWEKSGIIKSGTTFLSAERDESVRAVFADALNVHPPKKQEYVPKPEMVSVSVDGTDFTHAGKQYHLGVIGHHQAQNAVLAIEAARALNIPFAAIKEGLANTTRPSCMEVMQRKPLVIIDGAHNEDKMRSTVDALDQVLRGFDTKPTVHCMFAITDTKDHAALLGQLKPYVDEFYFTAYEAFGFRKPTDPSVFAEFAKSHNMTAQTFPNSGAALEAILHNAKDDDIVLITGSIMLVGETRQHWISEQSVLERRRP